MQRTASENRAAPHRIVSLLSGGGRTLRNILDCIERGDLSARVTRVVSTRKRVAGNSVATDAGVPLTILPRRSFDTSDAFSDAVLEVLDAEAPDLVVCAGFLSKLEVPARYMGRITNVHPSLLPLFGGKGYYGDRVHRAVLQSGMRVSGCTVHFIDNAYDAGPIIAQRCVPVYPDDSPDSLGARVFKSECELYPLAIREVLAGRVWLDGDRVNVAPDSAIVLPDA